MQRNLTVDIIRGLAMLMVILQHTISGTSSAFQNTFFFNLIWSIQMPLFFIISGYVTRFSKPVANLADLGKYIKKRTVSYLFPWIVWTFVIRGFICKEKTFFDLKFLLWHMDTGYWFLVSLWTIVILYGCADYLANKINKGMICRIVAHCIFMAIASLPIIIIALYWGINFLSIKLSLYYIPLYMCGYLFGQLQLKFSQLDNHKIIPILTSVAAVLWIYILTRLDFYGQEMNMTILLARYLVAIVGCSVVIFYLSSVYKNGGWRIFQYVGVYSLEIYVIHYVFLNLLKTGMPIDNMSMYAFMAILLNYVVTIGLSILTIEIIQKNYFLRKILFFRKI